MLSRLFHFSLPSLSGVCEHVAFPATTPGMKAWGGHGDMPSAIIHSLHTHPWALCWTPDTVRPGEHKAPALQSLRLVAVYLSDPGIYKALFWDERWPTSWDQVAPFQWPLGLLKSDETLSCNCVVSKAPNAQRLLRLMQILKKKISGHPAD